MRVDARTLNRTLLLRQGLLARRTGTVEEFAHRLVGLQAQETLSPYLGLAARLDDFDPARLGSGLESGSLVRMVCLRGTIHLLAADDALTIRGWTSPVQERERQVSQVLREVRDLELTAFRAAVSDALAAGPLSVKALGVALAATYPDRSPTALGGLARVALPLAQLPPRGILGRSGGVVYQSVDRWLDRPLGEPDPAELVRRYLVAFGPSSPADVTAWSGVPGAAALLGGMTDLVRHEDERGRVLFDVADGAWADADAPAPVRLLGLYDNVWLSHAGRDRVTTPDTRRQWAGSNGGLACTVFADGWLTGLWRPVAGRVDVVRLFRTLSRSERNELDEEIARVEPLLARPLPAPYSPSETGG